MKKLISNQLTPHFDIPRALEAFGKIKFLFNQKDLDFSREFGTQNYKLFNSARTALDQICKIVNPQKIGIPAVCCAVMATPFLASNKEIEWLETTENGTLDLNDLAQKADKIDLLIVPHTFGQKIKMAEVAKITREKNIIIVEDGAHLFEPISEFSDAKIFSFGREKDISCVSGGALTWNANSPFANKFAEIKLPPAKKWWTFRHLCQPLILSFALSCWFQGGKYFAGFWNKIKLLPRAVTKKEKNGAEDFPQTTLPRPLQEILKQSFRYYQKDFHHRQKLVKKWQPILEKKFPDAQIIVPKNFFRIILVGLNRQEIKRKSQIFGFSLEEWDGNPISPLGVNLAKFGYQKGQCPCAEKFIKNYLTLPTNLHLTDSDIERFSKIEF